MKTVVFILSNLIIFCMNFYIYKIFISIKFFENFKIIFAIIFIFMAIFSFIFIMCELFNLFNPFYKISAFCFGISFFGFFICVFYNICVILFAKLNIKIFLDLMLILSFIFFTAKGYLNAISVPDIKNVEIKIQNLKNPLNFAMVSDLHVGKYLNKDFVKNLVDKINQIKNLDAVFIVGDIIDLKGDEIGDQLDDLKNLKSKFGTFYVSGNHEFYQDIEGILNKISSLNIKILDNKNFKLNDINLVGISDLSGFWFNRFLPDIKTAFKNIDPKKPIILLSHQPKFITKFLLKSKFKADLVLSGHTHAGQIFPFHFLVKLDQPFLYGLYNFDENSQIYVSSGAGFWGPPFRIFAKNEIVNLKLKGYK